jgi:hypothetical protein
MASVVRIRCLDVVALIERAADKITGGDTTDVVAIAVRRLLAENEPTQSLFGSHPGSVRVRRGVDLLRPVLLESVKKRRARK